MPPASVDKARQTACLIDTPNFVYRAFHALPPLTTSKGQPTGAVYGFVNMLLKLLQDVQPTYIAAIFDAGEPTFRLDMHSEYKANRPATPVDLEAQFPFIRSVLEGFRIPMVEEDGYEADDIIASLALKLRDNDIDPIIVSSDKDLMQLVDERIKLLDTMKGKLFGPTDVLEKFGVSPTQLGDWLALVGDSVDNIPGVPGIGAKTAVKLLQEFGSLDELLANKDRVRPIRLREVLQSNEAQARTSRELARLCLDCPLPVAIPDLARQAPDNEALAALFDSLEFGRLRERISAARSIPPLECQTIRTREDLHAVIGELRAAREFGLAIASGDRAELPSGLSFAWEGNRSCFIPLATNTLDLLGQLDAETASAELQPVLADPSVLKDIHDSKQAIQQLRVMGLELKGLSCDTMLAAYALDPSRDSEHLESLVLGRYGYELGSTTGARRRSKDAPAAPVGEILADHARFTQLLADDVGAELAKSEALRRLYEDIELPLSKILDDMECHGCSIDTGALRELSTEIGRQLLTLERRVHEEAGWPVNLNSPKQLQQLLFDQLGLTPPRKTKTGFSTDAEVLAELALENPIAALIDEYRGLAKLQGTYVEALPAAIDPKSGRIHTCFKQAIAATGRLSCSEPNLQNIPIRTETGRRIRASFVAPQGHVLVSCDYSQIELRVLAHLSHDAGLIEAFRTGEDIHARTAAEVFGGSSESITAEQRRIAKAVNFGVIYGQGDWGLSRQLKIPQAAAREYITHYFARHPGVMSFMKSVIDEARKLGFAQTLLGRVRRIPDLNSKLFPKRSAAERVARNTPIQGTAADLLKLAMIQVAHTIAEQKLPATMILSVHDELLFEVAENCADEVAATLKHVMESVMPLDVPLCVDTGVGKNWAEAH